jgi:integrase
MQPHTTHRITGNAFTVQRKRGPVWYLKLRLPDPEHPGRMRQRKQLLGPCWTERGRPPAGYYTAKMADQELQAMLTDARRGTLAIAHVTGHTFNDAVEEWLRYLEHERGRSATTVRDYRNGVKRYLLPMLGEETPVAAITTEDVDNLREKLLTQSKLSRRSIQKLMVHLYGVMKRAKRRKWIPTNPCEDAERVTLKPSGDFNVLTPEEVYAVARVADSHQDRALFMVAAFTGLRLGELLALRWGDVDFAGQTIHVRRNYTHSQEGEPKSGKVRSVPLIDQAAAELNDLSKRDDYTQPGDLVFVSDLGGYTNGYDVRQSFYGALKRAGLGHKRTASKPIVFHDLRHTFGTLAVKAWDLPKVQAYMGHANVATTMIYVHHVPKASDADALTALVSDAQSVAGTLQSVPVTA